MLPGLDQSGARRRITVPTAVAWQAQSALAVRSCAGLMAADPRAHSAAQKETGGSIFGKRRGVELAGERPHERERPGDLASPNLGPVDADSGYAVAPAIATCTEMRILRQVLLRRR
jgi:hypothetical protein